MHFEFLNAIQESEVETLEDEFSTFQMKFEIMHGEMVVAASAA
jgi:hypothetical protein